jgi:DUF4097 and DUF4098 domain-containing protein YvlB
MNTRIVLALCAAASLSLESWAANKDVMERTFEVTPGGHLEMQVDRGSIHISSSESDTIKVRVIRELKRASQKAAEEVYELHKVDITQSGNTVRVESQNPQKFRIFRKDPFNRLQVEYDVAIPSRFSVQLRTAGGNIDIGQVEGNVEANTSGGSVTLKGARGDAHLQTSGGNVRVGHVEGKVDARTSGGSITIESVSGPIEAHTGGGSIEIRDARGPVIAKTSGGNVSAKMSKQPMANSALQTSGGNVSVSLAENIAVDVSARTSGGRVSSDFQGEVNKSHTQLTAQINGGGPNLVLETSGGNVKIRRD